MWNFICEKCGNFKESSQHKRPGDGASTTILQYVRPKERVSLCIKNVLCVSHGLWWRCMIYGL